MTRTKRPAPRQAGWNGAAPWGPVFAGLFIATLFWNSSAAAQQAESKSAAPDKAEVAAHATPPENTNTTLTKRVNVNVVNVPVTVLGKNGLPVIDLTQNDFQVFEDGQQQAIKYFLRGSRPPLRIGLIMDTSNSARREFQYQKDAASEFVFNMLQGQNSKNQMFLETFDANTSVPQDFTNDPDALNEKILGLKAGGGKAFYDALYFACREKMLKSGPPSENRRVIVVISDGMDAQSTHTMAEVISMAHKAETIIYTLGNVAWGYDNPGDKVLKEIAEETGGASLFPQEKEPGTDLGTGYLSHGQIGDTSQNKGLGAGTGIYSAERLEQLADSLDAISRELTDQYSIGYTPTNDKMDGTYRTIRVVALRKGLEIRFKPGYFASAQQ
ncbi:MAG TPA: VWA domain-containing protein [Terriglobia bacterium]|nr:VWA domain-containing protein [Terriglobia bacterium]